MLQFKFDTTKDLVDFLLNTPEFAEWELLICRFSCSNGLNINMNTSIIDTSNKASHIKLKLALPTIENFYKTITDSSLSELNIEVKLQLPITLKSNFDPDDEYNGFYLSTYSDGVTIVSSSSHSEKSMNSGLAPLQNWDSYYAQLYQKWYNKNKLPSEA